ncbi:MULTISPECIES: DUF1648 domain-containing protein [unclassified Arthrobacter]|uniref:DUF1648 domain-containing protein n=1 Tax=unclassified Arthrobacter TaxID=235627 RepID=UPI001D138515|nr:MULTISPECIES: DUF1648 domain-containing protein [unclassified Arthrobacter]MCC3276039.1 DUF1648 domain-containing protein [Arthrobacter sp. zg-Y20]MCC9176376.1 DUF1648 domain-containing protein [Arthrobacter sp. zg-Y750]MDK1316196.1 DUF1648 domain-containing protein [Arthrobacter sp. zg.Y20]WIB05525.1 DUF1648 domain-containing protein [Arthrobacter sp. zg-Y20]
MTETHRDTSPGGVTVSGASASTVPGPAYGWYVAAAVVVLAAAGAGAVLYPDLPQSLPVHWNGAGQADSYAPKSTWSVFAAPLIALGMLLFLLGTAAVIPRLAALSGQLHAGGPAAHTANIRATQFFLGGTAFALSMLFAWLALRGWLLPPDGSALEFVLPTVALFLAMAGFGVAAVRRYRREVAGTSDAAAEEETAEGPGDEPDAPAAGAGDPVAQRCNYRAGIYVNRADPRLLVPKRLGVGWTLNAGRPAGLAFYLLIGLVSVAALVAGIALPLLAP